jgi:hypothetical protein
MDTTTRSEAFFADLPRMAQAGATFEPARYRAAPGDWELVVTDIVGSTQRVASGQHKTVNFVAAMAIAALKNLCAPTPLPFLFGGDGSVVLVPPAQAPAARVALARLRGFAAREFGMQLRVGICPVALLRQFGSDVTVGRFEPTPGNSFGVFQGGGVGLLERAVRGRADAALVERVAVPEALDDGEPVDLDGLSCRWNPLQSGRGRMLTLIIHGADDAGAVFDAVMRMARQGGNAAPVRAETLSTSWPPKGWLLEAQASRHGGSLWRAGLRVLALTLLARLIFLVGRPVGGFDPQHYVAEIASNTDFCKHDDTVSFVIDCPLDCIAAIQDYLEREHMAGRLRYGMHVSQTALMTCLVTNASGGLHVHFVDGGDGGYTSAARTLKAQLAPARTG